MGDGDDSYPGTRLRCEGQFARSEFRVPHSKSPHPVREHRLGDFDEAGDVGAALVVHEAVLGAVAHALVVDGLHDTAEAFVDLLPRPRHPQRVLRVFRRLSDGL